MKDTLLVAVLVLAGCGRGLYEPVDEATAPAQAALAPQLQPLPAPVRKCVVDKDLAKSRWQCDTVSALEIVSMKVTNADGSEPWTAGLPRVTAVMRNTTGVFLNYPGLQVAASAASLKPSYARDALYGLGGCGQAELNMSFGGTTPKGTQVTFTAMPVHINGDECPLAKPPMTLTVTAP